MVLEVYLDYLVTEPKHDGMLSSHPFLDIDKRGASCSTRLRTSHNIISFVILVGLQIGSEML